MILKTTIEDETWGTLEVEGEHIPPCPGSRDRHGVPEEPDTDAEMIVRSITTKENAVLWPSRETLDKAEEALWEKLEA